MNIQNLEYKKSLVAFIHILIGALFLFRVTGQIYSLLVLVIGVVSIIKSKNKNNEAALWSAYMVGLDVFLRMSKGIISYELPKYSVLLFLIIGLYVEQKRHHISVSYLIYILLLLLGIVFVDIPFGESIRKAIAFNLSGPVTLGISAIYFYNRRIQLDDLMTLLYAMVLPIISMVVFLFLKTPDLKDIVFNSAANKSLSGGFGPNQVATILGLGIFIFFVHLVYRKRVFSLFLIDALFFIYLIYRGLLTFSRGGMLTALIAILSFSFFYLLSSKNGFKQFIKYSFLVSVLGVLLWTYTASKTGGMLTNRYTNKSSDGAQKEDVTAGRVDIFEAELEGYIENPFFGLGVGGSKYYRADKLGVSLASHNEIGRLLSEHGMIGLLILLLLLIVPARHILQQPLLTRGLLSAFLILWFLTISHSAMRIAFPSFIYGLSVITIVFPNSSKQKYMYAT